MNVKKSVVIRHVETTAGYKNGVVGRPSTLEPKRRTVSIRMARVLLLVCLVVVSALAAFVAGEPEPIEAVYSYVPVKGYGLGQGYGVKGYGVKGYGLGHGYGLGGGWKGGYGSLVGYGKGGYGPIGGYGKLSYGKGGYGKDGYGAYGIPAYGNIGLAY